MTSRMSAVASLTYEVNLRLAKRPLKSNGRLAYRGLTSIVKEAFGDLYQVTTQFKVSL